MRLPNTAHAATAVSSLARRPRLPRPPAIAGKRALNVEGRRPNWPENGFGQMWEKTYTMRLSPTAPQPEEVIATWKKHFTEFWPPGNDFHMHRRMKPGEVGSAHLSMPGGVKLRTGMVVLDSGPRSFTLITPQGHMFAGNISFTADREQGQTVVRTHMTMRSSDPVYELGLMLRGHGAEDDFWRETLVNLGGHFGEQRPVTVRRTLLDPRRKWRHATNTWHNAGIRTVLYKLTAPLRWLLRLALPWMYYGK